MTRSRQPPAPWAAVENLSVRAANGAVKVIAGAPGSLVGDEFDGDRTGDPPRVITFPPPA
ncbi:hypothetical protein Ssi03_03530 [Sphaerisporangium siamense]|nr:hypothetical protein Ssi03_03530 [Sphaerisporangium siamense]